MHFSHQFTSSFIQNKVNRHIGRLNLHLRFMPRYSGTATNYINIFSCFLSISRQECNFSSQQICISQTINKNITRSGCPVNFWTQGIQMFHQISIHFIRSKTSIRRPFRIRILLRLDIHQRIDLFTHIFRKKYQNRPNFFNLFRCPRFSWINHGQLSFCPNLFFHFFGKRAENILRHRIFRYIPPRNKTIIPTLIFRFVKQTYCKIRRTLTAPRSAILNNSLYSRMFFRIG